MLKILLQPQSAFYRYYILIFFFKSGEKGVSYSLVSIINASVDARHYNCTYLNAKTNPLHLMTPNIGKTILLNANDQIYTQIIFMQEMLALMNKHLHKK